jgi:predicted lipoprotein with Yx(FWY)xxD motif
MPSNRPLRAKRSLWLLATAVALIAVAGLATLAIAKTAKKAKPNVKTAHNASLGATILVDRNGMTLYELKPETSKHLLCTSSACIHVFWPPAKVGKTEKLAKGTGVKGSLRRLPRKGFDQLTLDGHPLYHFFLDKHKGSDGGNGIMSFGGTWHVVKESSSSKSTTTTTTSTTTSTTTTSSPYSYPGY